jgi:hypothetical protein
LPHKPVKDDRRIDALYVVTLVNNPAPPRLLYVVAKLHSQWAIVPGAAQPSIDFRRRKYKTSPLGERYKSVNVRCRHRVREKRASVLLSVE